MRRARAVAVALGLAGLLTGCGAAGPTRPVAAPSTRVSPDAAAVADARAFLAAYVDPDGRVVRRDQGGDTVSEGQAYALLLAVAVGDRGTAERVWGWARAHLQRPDGLLSYLWRDGRVADPEPAADADTQLAWGLLLGADRLGHPEWREAARRVAVSAAAQEVGYDAQGRAALAAGPFGRGGSGKPVVAEPGYWAPPVTAALADLTGDGRWRGVADALPGLLRDATAGGRSLPPDWVELRGGAPVAVPPPSGGGDVRCALDGQRALVWAALDPATRPLAAGWWGLVRGSADAAPLARGLDGSTRDGDASPLSAVASAAAAGAAGDAASRDRLLARADDLAHRYPTYYGAAWAALGRVLLTTGRLTTGPSA